ncbi:RagB/SusD family nutrient uptake outer membrane protein [Niabella pedocola]|uniref:RagB/SusD family nutrient uptake outer membrane protein n=1 Tax=Niabella pedocola TaxID=1752077 RepID=A0ABS8PNU0_9BACT|nr:RagB/SusD family nutrient uptake outer membrane protein [Niabella pedocola]MCD2422530.1 RagB/SusD family nutrient uptake outer membrane protein [Niabella pedocola]
MIKRTTIFILLLIAVIATGSLSSCKKYLDVDPVNAMSGNNFWKTRDDVERFTTGAYTLLRRYTAMGGHTLLAIGDLRATAWTISGASDQPGIPRSYIPLFNNNDMKGLLRSDEWWQGAYNNWSAATFGIDNMSDWGFLYQVVNAANTLLINVDAKGIAGLADADRARYKAEAKFLRSVTYYLLVRHFGDVPYIIDANDKSKHERTGQLTVFKNCIEELRSAVSDLPWTYPDPTLRGVRAMKGGAYALMMEMYMWMAGFDEEHATEYYQQVADLGNLLVNQNEGSYELLSLDNMKDLFKGNSRESLFEVGQDFNYGETFGLLVTLADIVLRTPYKRNVNSTYIYYNSEYLHRLYDAAYNGNVDRRMDLWFERDNMYNTAGQFVFLKFINTYGTSGENENPNDNKILFRLADAILLRAEALEKLGRYDEALSELNKIRQRAGAEPFAGGNMVKTASASNTITLEDAIWWERERELMGEGTMFYDLVRTRHILDSKYTPNAISYEEFVSGAWTYPIHNEVMRRNPLIKPNTFWL